MNSLGEEIGNLLKTHRLNLGIVESSTGGRISDRITQVPGSSEYFAGSVVAYDNKVKIELLWVEEATIKEHGAVSAQTAEEMAQGGKRLLNASLCLSVTGIAGPSGATPEKPVGLVYIGLASEGHTQSRKYIFQGTRDEHKQRSYEAALSMLREYLAWLPRTN